VRAGVDELAVTEYELHLGYDYFNAEQILRQMLPAGVEVPGSFETVGHIAHLNLRDELSEYRHVIGRVLLDKNPRLRTVVNKVGSIASEFRVPTWELLAGDTSLETEVRQHGIPFKLDFGEVYWNSRLEAEHRRVVELIKPGEVLCDAMAGVGPFAVPAARAGVRVYANDLNPQCAHYLRVNAHGSKAKHMVKCYNLDARAFIRSLLRPKVGPGARAEPGAGPGGDVDGVPGEKEQASASGVGGAATATAAQPMAPVAAVGGATGGADGKRKPKPAKPVVKWAVKGLDDDEGEPPAGAIFDHVTMNLPASAIEFLDVFKGAFDREVWGSRRLPTIHCYTFKRATETYEDVVRRGEGYLGAKITDPYVHEVRDVAPNKIMLCLTFTLTPDVAFWEGECAATNKRARTSE
jgi:tRNA (guanine37-N1)-methyltransferase